MGRGRQATERPAQVEELAEWIEHWGATRTKRGSMAGPRRIRCVARRAWKRAGTVPGRVRSRTAASEVRPRISSQESPALDVGSVGPSG